MTLRNIFTDGATCGVAIEGEVTIYSVAGLKRGLDELDPVFSALEIDLAGVTEIDTAGLQLLLTAKHIEGRNVRFTNHSDAVLQLLALMNLSGAACDVAA